MEEENTLSSTKITVKVLVVIMWICPALCMNGRNIEHYVKHNHDVLVSKDMGLEDVDNLMQY